MFLVYTSLYIARHMVLRDRSAEKNLTTSRIAPRVAISGRSDAKHQPKISQVAQCFPYGISFPLKGDIFVNIVLVADKYDVAHVEHPLLRIKLENGK